MFPKEIFLQLIQRMNKILINKSLPQMLFIKKSQLSDLIKQLGKGFVIIYKDLKASNNLELKSGTKVVFF